MADFEKVVCGRTARRVVAIAGPVHAVFARTCKVLNKDMQAVATAEIEKWNRRHARRAQAKAKSLADQFVAPATVPDLAGIAR